MQNQTFQDAFQRLMRIQQQKKELPKQTLQQLKMADDFFDNKDFPSAVELYDNIVKVFKKYYGKTDQKTIEIYYKMAKSLQELGTPRDHSEAIDLYKIVMDNSDPNSDMFKLSLAHTFFLDKESEIGTEKALEIYQPLLAKYTEKYGPDDARTMDIYNYTARAVYYNGDLQKVQQMYKKISQYRQKIKGQADEYTLKAFHFLANIYLVSNKVEKALPLIEKLLIYADYNLLKPVGKLLNLIKPEKKNVLVPYLERALEVRSKTLGIDHNITKYIIQELIIILIRIEDYEKALILYESFPEEVKEDLDIRSSDLKMLQDYKKKKLQQVKKQLGQQSERFKALQRHHRTIVIDDFEFVAVSRANLVYKGDKFENRNYVQLMSKNIHTNEINNFHVYQSNSEIGAWRYCRSTNDILFKGADYITVTFVHFELQKYLYSVFDSLTIDHEFEYCPEITDKDAHALNSRIQKDAVFDLLSLCSSSFKCFFNNKMLIQNVQSFSKNQQWTMPTLLAFSQIKSSKDYLENITNLIQGMNMYLQQFLSVDIASFAPIYSYSFSIANQAFFDCTIYKGSVVNIKNHKKYFMFINHYHYKNTQHSEMAGTYSFVTFIVPQDAKITANGVYDKVIKTGIYAYKAVEYATGMDIYADEKQRKKNTQIVHQRDIGWDNNLYDYYFIGDIMNQFWPLSEIHF